MHHLELFFFSACSPIKQHFSARWQEILWSWTRFPMSKRNDGWFVNVQRETLGPLIRW